MSGWVRFRFAVQSEHFGDVAPMAVQNPRVVTVARPPIHYRVLRARRSAQRCGGCVVLEHFFFFLRHGALYTFYIDASSVMPFDPFEKMNELLKFTL